MLSKFEQILKIKGYFYNPSFIVFFRVSVGALMLVHFLSIWSDFDLLYGRNAIIPAELNNAYETMDFIDIGEIIVFLEKLFSYHASLTIVKCVFVALCFLVMLGYQSRFFALVLLFLQISIVKSGINFSYGVDYFESMSLFYIIFFPSNISIKFQYPKIDYTLYKRLIQYHLSLSYFFSGLAKIMGYNWWNGESIWKATNLPNFTKYIELRDITENYFVYTIIGWLIIIIELLYPVFIHIDKTRKVWLCLTIGMHLGIILLLNLYFFAIMMIIWNLTSFYFNYYDNEKN